MDCFPEEPFIKRPRVEESVSLNKLPKWFLEKILIKLTVTERLRMERVDWFWNATAGEFGLTGLRELSYGIVFGGAERVRLALFNNESLVALFERARKGLNELDLGSFKANRLPITMDVCASLNLLPSLSRIDIMGFNLLEAVPFLPTTLCEIRSSGPHGGKTFSALAAKFPKLEGISLESIQISGAVAVSCVNEFLHKYPSLKRLCLTCPLIRLGQSLTSIGVLRELEEFDLQNHNAAVFNETAFKAMIEGCKKLRRLAINSELIASENVLCQLSKLSNLVELVIHVGFTNVTDSDVKAISKCRTLKKLDISFCKLVTDTSVIDLIENCKLLVSLNVKGCRRISRKSLLAIVAEVNRRHGDPARTLPKGPIDKRIFYFQCMRTAIDWRKAQKMTEKNPWLTVEYSRELAERSF